MKGSGNCHVNHAIEEFVDRLVTLCRAGRHAHAVALSDQHAEYWAVLSLTQMGAVYSELISSALANADGAPVAQTGRRPPIAASASRRPRLRNRSNTDGLTALGTDAAVSARRATATRQR